jgi:hypothetical protein
MSEQDDAAGPAPTRVVAADRDSRHSGGAEALKERIYITFTALAVCITLESHAEELAIGIAAATLALTVFGTLLAVFVADIVSHMVTHSSLPDRVEFRHIVATTLGSWVVLVVPFLLLAIAALGLLSLSSALVVMSFVLVTTLVAVTLVAVYRLKVPLWQKAAALAAVLVLGLAVVALELAVH